MWKVTQGSFTNFGPITSSTTTPNDTIRIDWTVDNLNATSDENSNASALSSSTHFSPTITTIKLYCVTVPQISNGSSSSSSISSSSSKTSAHAPSHQFYITLFPRDQHPQSDFYNIITQPTVDRSNQALMHELLHRRRDADGLYWSFEVHHFAAHQLEPFFSFLKHQIRLSDDMIADLTALCLPYVRVQTPSETAFFKSLLEIEACTKNHKMAQALLNQKFDGLLIQAQGILDGAEYQEGHQFIIKINLRQYSDALWRLVELCRILNDIPHRIVCLKKLTSEYEDNIYCTDTINVDLADLIRLFQSEGNLSPDVNSLDDEERKHKQNANMLMKVAAPYLQSGIHGAPILFNILADHAALPEKAQQALNNLPYNSDEDLLSGLIKTLMIFAESHYELVQEITALRTSKATAPGTSSPIPSTMTTTAALSTENTEESGSPATTSLRTASSPAILNAYSASTVPSSNHDARQSTNTGIIAADTANPVLHGSMGHA